MFQTTCKNLFVDQSKTRTKNQLTGSNEKNNNIQLIKKDCKTKQQLVSRIFENYEFSVKYYNLHLEYIRINKQTQFLQKILNS